MIGSPSAAGGQEVTSSSGSNGTLKKNMKNHMKHKQKTQKGVPKEDKHEISKNKLNQIKMRFRWSLME